MRKTSLQPLALPEALSRELVVNLMRQSVENVAAMPPAAALTRADCAR